MLGGGGSVTSAKIAAAGGLLAANNLSDLASAATGRTNLGVAGGLAQISQTILGANTAPITISGIPATYRDLLLIVDLRSNRVASTDDDLGIRFNNDSAGNYVWQRTQTVNVTQGDSIGVAVTSIGGVSCPASLAPAGASAPIQILIPDYRNTLFRKNVLIHAGFIQSDLAAGQINQLQVRGEWRSTAAINRIDLVSLNAAQWLTGSVATLYGIGS